MKDQSPDMPGLERVRLRFLEMLDDRQARIADHALAARAAGEAAQINHNLDAARGILHQIAGTAGVLGYATLGAAARECEDRVIVHLDGPDAALPDCPTETIQQLDRFVAECRITLNGRG